jgi:hypothetical protein
VEAPPAAADVVRTPAAGTVGVPEAAGQVVADPA